MSNLAEVEQIHEVEPRDLFEELERCRGWIESALAYSGNTHDFLHIVQGVISGHMQLWAGEEGCAVTEINVYPKRKILHVFLAGGKMEQILDFEKSAIQFAKLNGCSALSLAGRKGWAKVHKNRGWKEHHVTLIKEF
jgi:hypothetical protein